MEDDAGDVVYTIEEVAALLKVKVSRVKWLLRKGELRCKYISPRIRRVTAKHYNDYITGTDTWHTEAKGNALKSGASSSIHPAGSTPTGESAGLIPLPNKHEAYQLVLRMMRPGTSGE